MKRPVLASIFIMLVFGIVVWYAIAILDIENKPLRTRRSNDSPPTTGPLITTTSATPQGVPETMPATASSDSSEIFNASESSTESQLSR